MIQPNPKAHIQRYVLPYFYPEYEPSRNISYLAENFITQKVIDVMEAPWIDLRVASSIYLPVVTPLAALYQPPPPASTAPPPSTQLSYPLPQYALHLVC